MKSGPGTVCTVVFVPESLRSI